MDGAPRIADLGAVVEARMILLGSDVHQSLLQSLSEVETTGDSLRWEREIRRPDRVFCDGFLAFLAHPIAQRLFGGESRFTGLSQWFLEARTWTQERVLRPAEEVDIAEYCLYLIWERFNELLRDSLRAARTTDYFPSKGGVLAFVAGLSQCVVLDFKFEGAVPELNVVALIPNPQSVFDFWGAIDQAGVRARNHLKRILTSGEKLVWNRGVLTHVDRRRDAGVFGPTIDTVILSELLCQSIIENEYPVKTALEVGSGSGMLSATLAATAKELHELFAVDIDAKAVTCTNRNIDSAVLAARQHPPNVYLVTGFYSPDLLDRRFDFVVCNPPYVPKLFMPENGDLPYFQATAGTELLVELLHSTPKLLAPGGHLLLMTSSICVDEALDAVPDGMDLRRPLGTSGYEVLFDVEPVIEQPKWIDHLLSAGGLEERGGLYYHRLHPILVRRPAGG